MVQQKSNTIQALWVVLSSLSSMLLAIVSAAILSRYFDKVEYGTYRQITYIYSSLVVLFSAGLPNIFSYFLPRIDKPKGKELVQRVTKMLLVFGLIFGLFLFLGAPLIARFMGNLDMVPGLRKFAIVPVLLLPTMGLDGIFASNQQTHLLAIFHTINRLVMLLFIVLPVVYLENSSDMAINGWIFASLFSLGLSWWFKNLPYKGISAEYSTIKNKELFAYSVPLVMASMYGMLIRYADQFYISNYFGPEIYAEFSNGFIEIPLTAVITGSVSTVLTPLFSKNSLSNEGIISTLNVWKNVFYKSAVILYPIVVFLYIFGKEIMIFVYSKNYEQSGIYFQINTILNFFNIITFTPILYAYNKVKFYSNLHLFFAIIAWVLGYLIVIQFNDPIGIAILSTSIQIAFVIISVVVVSKLLKVGIFEIIPFKTLSKILLSSFLVAIITKEFVKYILSDAIDLKFILISGLIYLLLLTSVWWILKIELGFISMAFKEKINKIRQKI